MFLFDRSRLEAYQRCPRRYYWQYVYKGLGLAPYKRAIPLAFGGAMHLGLEQVLREEGIERAVEVALRDYEEQCRGRGLELKPQEDAYSVYHEQRSLLEALLRAWFIVRYPSFTKEYEVLDLEKEELWKVAPDITMMARADGVLRNRAEGDLYVLSFKTAKQFTRATAALGRSDIQGISELVAVEERLGERVQGVQMEYLIKGRRDEWPKGSGLYPTSSPLVRPWVGLRGQYAHSWDWSDMDGKHTLGNKFRKFYVPDQMSIAQWIDLLATGTVQPEAGPCLERWVVSPLPYNRNRDEIGSWKEQVRSQVELMQAAGEAVEEDRKHGEYLKAPIAFLNSLDTHLPQYRHSCEYPQRCPMYEICFGAAGQSPEDSGRYVKREPHHEAEQQEQEDA